MDSALTRVVLTLDRGMTRDEEVHPDPESFNPERFIKDGVLNKEIRDPHDIIFGFGRRCVLCSSHSIIFEGYGLPLTP
jgi:cytochrome P450